MAARPTLEQFIANANTLEPAPDWRPKELEQYGLARLTNTSPQGLPMDALIVITGEREGGSFEVVPIAPERRMRCKVDVVPRGSLEPWFWQDDLPVSLLLKAPQGKTIRYGDAQRLEAASIRTIGELRSLSCSQLRKIPGIGLATARKVDQALKTLGLREEGPIGDVPHYRPNRSDLQEGWLPSLFHPASIPSSGKIVVDSIRENPRMDWIEGRFTAKPCYTPDGHEVKISVTTHEETP